MPVLIFPGRRIQQKPAPGTQIDWGHPLAQAIVGCWLFNEGAGDVAYNSASPYLHGVLDHYSGTTDPTWHPGGPKFHGRSLRFFENGHRVTVSHHPKLDLTTHLSIHAQTFRENRTASIGAFLAKTDGSTYWDYDLFVDDADGMFEFYAETPAIQTCVGNFTPPSIGYRRSFGVSVLPSGTGFSSHGRMYYEGVRISTCTMDFTSLAIHTGPLYLGWDYTAQSAWQGPMDHVMLWARALSDGEFAQLAENPYCFMWVPRRAAQFALSSGVRKRSGFAGTRAAGARAAGTRATRG